MIPQASFLLTLLLGLLIALTPLGTDAWQPILPALAGELGAPAGAAQLTVTAFFIGIAAGQLAWGPISDRFGRKPAIVAGLGLACLAMLVCIPATSLGGIVLGRFIQGLGMSCGPVIARAVVRDLYSHEQAAGLLARMSIVFSVVPIAAPLLGAALLLLGSWRAVLWFYLAMCALLFAAAAAGLRESAPAARASMHPADIGRAFGSILAEPRFVAPFGAMLCSQVGIFAFVTNSAFTLVNGLGLSATAYSFMFATVMLGQIGGAWASSRLVARFGMARLLRAGSLLVAGAGLGAASFAWSGVAHWLAVVAPLMAYMCGTALIVPNATAAALSPFPHTAGAASSLMGSTQFAVGAAVSTVLGLLFDGTTRPLCTAVALAGLGTFAIERIFLHGKR